MEQGNGCAQPEFDPTIHPINRLKICATLRYHGAVAGTIRYEMKFAKLRDAVDVSDATLSKQLLALEGAGYIARTRDYGATRAKDVVWVSLTEKGLAAFEAHMAYLRTMAEID